MTNALKTFVLLTALTLFLLFVGQAVGGQNGMILAFGIAAVMNFVSYFFSDKIALAIYRAKPITREQAPRVYNIVERLCMKTNLPMPKLFIIPQDSPNAFATGRNPKHASVAVTEGILNLLSDDELEGVLAHELGHVRNRDILIASIAATLAGAITMIARMAYWGALFGGHGGSRDDRGGSSSPIVALAMMILAPIAALLIQMAVSRQREYAADATAAEMTGNPYSLANALQKLDAYSKRLPMAANPATAHMFIVKPMLGGMDFASLFSTHPPIPQRIARLTGMSMDQFQR